MQRRNINSVAYLMKQARDNASQKVEPGAQRKNTAKPIVFLGAGASATAGIPLADKITKRILEDYGEKPELHKLDAKARQNYYTVMGCLTASERYALFRDLITAPDVRVNVTHIYLAQLLREGYVDYVLTVNFDDLMIRACALFNFIPPVYDLSILRDLTTTTFQERSVIYLHGQHHGLWQLNTDEELTKVRTTVSNTLQRICHGRTWIVVGYSGADPILEHIAELGRFDNWLFWVGYRDDEPLEKVRTLLLDRPHTDAFWVPGYDADSFFLKLHAELGLETPDILHKPFSFLRDVQKNIKDIEKLDGIADEHRLLFRHIQMRSKVSKRWVEDAIHRYEEEQPAEELLTGQELERDRLKLRIVEAIVREKYEHADELFGLFTARCEHTGADEEIAILLAILYNDWGNDLSTRAGIQNNQQLYEQSLEKYRRASELNPTDAAIWYNWGLALSDLAALRDDIRLYEQSLEKYQRASELDATNIRIWYNWGLALSILAALRHDAELYKQSFEKYRRASECDPQNAEPWHDWSGSLLRYARLVAPGHRKAVLVEAREKAEQSAALGGKRYNLACCHALLHEREAALACLEHCLSGGEVQADFVRTDDDWAEYRDDPDFQHLLARYEGRA